ncbi:MAG: RNA-binding protein, partial [Thermoanaerobaculia bacterium]|nr:RNA-binding protein [Thermoanaerobaculia bacterium]
MYRVNHSRRRRAIPAKVFVGNLSFKTTQQELTDWLSAAGQIVDVYLPTDRNTGRPRGLPSSNSPAMTRLRRPSGSSTPKSWEGAPCAFIRRKIGRRVHHAPSGRRRRTSATKVAA